MWQFLIYDIKSAAVIAVFYLFYRILLSKETFHRLNRVILLLTAALSLILPLCTITTHKSIAVPQAAMVSNNTVSQVAANHQFLIMGMTWWKFATICIFIAGVLFVLAKIALSIISVTSVISKGQKKKLNNGNILVITKEDISPFSWFRYIVATEEDAKHESILIHESAHIALNHSIDVICVNLLAAIQWFNPAIWMLRSDLKEIHEYEADAQVLEHGTDAKQYQFLLVRKAMADAGYSIANSFSHSTLKNRINMMLAIKSSAIKAFKALYIIPLIALSLTATAKTEYDYLVIKKQNSTSSVSGKDTSNIKKEKVKYYINGKKASMKQLNAIKTSEIDFIKIEKGEGKAVNVIIGDNASIRIPNTKSTRDTVKINTSVTIKMNPDKPENVAFEVAPKDAEYYIDGNKSDSKEFGKISPNDISELKIDKSNNQFKIIVLTKKSGQQTKEK